MLTYFGQVDDFAARHRDGAVTSSDQLNRHLLFAVLFGDPLVINDGYVIMSPAIRPAILEPKLSPLRQLVEAGHIKILTRNDRDLVGLAKHMADAGISSAKDLLRDADFPNLQRALAAWSSTLALSDENDENPSFRDWPRAYNTSEIFERLALAAVDQAVSKTSNREHRRQLQQFAQRFKSTERRNRTSWEHQVIHPHKNGLEPDIQYTLLRVANEAYQYSWGCALSEGVAPIKVQTRAPQFLDMDLSLVADNVPSRQGVRIYGPDLELAKKKLKNDWSRLVDVVTPGHDVYLAKRQFRNTLEAYYTSAAISDDEMKACAKAYSKSLALHFGGEGVPFSFDVTFTAASTAAGVAIAGPIGAGIGLGIGLIGNTAAHLGGPQLVRKVTLPLSKKWIKEQRADTVISSFQVDPLKAATVLEGVSTFRA
jgi:hypothetical protein